MNFCAGGPFSSLYFGISGGGREDLRGGGSELRSSSTFSAFFRPGFYRSFAALFLSSFSAFGFRTVAVGSSRWPQVSCKVLQHHSFHSGLWFRSVFPCFIPLFNTTASVLDSGFAAFFFSALFLCSKPQLPFWTLVRSVFPALFLCFLLRSFVLFQSSSSSSPSTAFDFIPTTSPLGSRV